MAAVEHTTATVPEYIVHAGVRSWVAQMAELCKPDTVHLLPSACAS